MISRPISASLTHELQQPAPRVVILHVRLEVLGELVDAAREDRDLDLGRAGVRLVAAVLFDEHPLLLGMDQGRSFDWIGAKG